MNREPKKYELDLYFRVRFVAAPKYLGYKDDIRNSIEDPF